MPLLFQSQAMMCVVEQARRYARSSATVLIVGESGTGKELLVRLIRDESDRRNEPLVRINCTSLSDTLFESELFGHERGSFTGAVTERRGRLEAAGKGTLLLDEVGDLSPRLQPKLLRVLEEAEYERVGSNDSRVLEARIVAATNRSLAEDVGRNRFRRDLYHRLNVLPLEVPALRQRREDVPLLVQHFIGRFRHESICGVKGLTPRAMRKLAEYDWPGNVRQLRNAIHRVCVLAQQDTIDLDALPRLDDSFDDAFSLPTAMETLPLREIERHVILHRLNLFDGNQTAAARALGVTSRTLRNKMSEYRRLGFAG
ncbi:MAG: sigma-54-dependent Fis family transcriptional regulator [Planctomycetaceae bacterium]|nr:sigma-54-dependent Fis family transcriptional regulator [Planctomycetaceae bacterium]